MEVGDQMVLDRLNRMIPSVIPDSLLAGPGAQEKWVQMIMASFKRVSIMLLLLLLFSSMKHWPM